MTDDAQKRRLLLRLRKWTFLFPPGALCIIWTGTGLGLAARIFGSVFIAMVAVVYLALVCVGLVRLDLLKLEWRGGAIPTLTRAPTLPDYDLLEAHRSRQKQDVAFPQQTNIARKAVAEATPSVTAHGNGFRGVKGDAKYPLAIRTDWDREPPKVLWKQPCGGGYSSFAFENGVAFTIEQRRKEEVVVAYDVLTGTEKWASPYYGLFEESLGGNGPRATPYCESGRLYALGALGTLRCLDTADGRLIWSTNILLNAHATLPVYGCAASPVVVGNSVIVAPGGAKAESVLAYDKISSQRVWNVLPDGAAYSSPSIVELAGIRQILVVTDHRVVGLGPENGSLLWEHPWSVRMGNQNIAQPLLIGTNRVFLSAGYGTGCEMIEVVPRKSGGLEAKSLWKNQAMKNKFSSSIHHEGFIYGLDEDRLACVDAESGERVWKDGRYGYGQLLFASGHLVILTGDGDVALVAARPDGHREVARVPVISGKTWNHPGLFEGFLMVRNAHEMACVDLRPR